MLTYEKFWSSVCSFLLKRWNLSASNRMGISKRCATYDDMLFFVVWIVFDWHKMRTYCGHLCRFSWGGFHGYTVSGITGIIPIKIHLISFRCYSDFYFSRCLFGEIHCLWGFESIPFYVCINLALNFKFSLLNNNMKNSNMRNSKYKN